MEEKVHVVKNTTKIIPTIKGEVRLWKMTSKLTIEESTMEIESFKLFSPAISCETTKLPQ